MHWKWSKEAKEKAKGKPSNTKGIKRPDVTKRNKENKFGKGTEKPGTSIFMKSDKNPMKNPITILKCNITKLKNRIKKLEQET